MRKMEEKNENVNSSYPLVIIIFLFIHFMHFSN